MTGSKRNKKVVPIREGIIIKVPTLEEKRALDNAKLQREKELSKDPVYSKEKRLRMVMRSSHKYFNKIFEENFKIGTDARIYKIVQYEDFYTLLVDYTDYNRKKKRKVFLMTDAGDIIPAIVPTREFQFGPHD